MSGTAPEHDVYLEVGYRRTFAIAVDWPGWARSGRDSEAALQALFEAGPRYRRLLATAELAFEPVAAVGEFEVVAELEGDSTTDFGSPGAIPEYDRAALPKADLPRLRTIFHACWHAFDVALEQARGRELRKGPRGGGRELNEIVEHVLGAQTSYLGRIGRKPNLDQSQPARAQLRAVLDEVLAGLAAGARGELPAEGPRGGVRWPARYFARRSAWHIVDHAWEIEDRLE